MTGSTRIKGKALGFKLGSPAVDYWADNISVVLDNEEKDSDVVTFGDVADGGDGGRQYFLTTTGITSTDVDSFWRYVWEHAGEDEVPFVFAPHGNAVASAAQPHFIGTCKVGPKPPIGTEAGQTSQFETRFEVNGAPTLDVGTP